MRKHVARWIILFTVALLSACTAVPISPNQTPNALDPRGPGAARIAELWWVMLALGAAVFVLVLVLLFAAILRRRRATSETPPDSRPGDTGRQWLTRGGILLPLVVIGVVFGYTIYTLAVVDKVQGQGSVEVEVIGRRWWWEVKYPDSSVTTANEMHIPVGVPVKIKLMSADVIHSFWIPELHGKMDLVPTRINNLTIQADHAGIFRGECAEFCGLQHAHMNFMVVAESSEAYNAWLESQKKDAADPTDPLAAQGKQVFISARCVYCHTVRGLDDKNVDRSGVDLGPDLTHLNSRLTLGSGSLTLNRGNLAGWIIDTQHVKPGNLMPNMEMESQELQALLAYLESLQ